MLLKNHFMLLFSSLLYSGELSISQKQAIIKLSEKKDRDKRSIKNWRPISLLNVDMKLISTVLAGRLKVISTIVNENQVAYVNNRFITESGRLIFDVLEITNSLDIERLSVTVDKEKAFDSINHSFLMCVLKKWIWQRISKIDTNLNEKPGIVCYQWW